MRTSLLPVTCLVAGGVADDGHERLVGVGRRVERVELGLGDVPASAGRGWSRGSRGSSG